MVPQMAQDKEALFFQLSNRRIPWILSCLCTFSFKTGSFLNASLSDEQDL